jgi:hypothetical protein
MLLILFHAAKILVALTRGATPIPGVYGCDGPFGAYVFLFVRNAEPHVRRCKKAGGEEANQKAKGKNMNEKD